MNNFNQYFVGKLKLNLLAYEESGGSHFGVGPRFHTLKSKQIRIRSKHVTTHAFQLFGTLAQCFNATVVRKRNWKYSYHVGEHHHNPNTPMKRTKYCSVPTTGNGWIYLRLIDLRITNGQIS